MPNTVPAAGEAMPNDDIKPFVSLGEAANSVVDRLKARRDATDAMEEASLNVARGRSVLKTAWLALGSPDFDEDDDKSDVRETIYEAMRMLSQADDRLGNGIGLLLQLREAAR